MRAKGTACVHRCIQYSGHISGQELSDSAIIIKPIIIIIIIIIIIMLYFVIVLYTSLKGSLPLPLDYSESKSADNII